MNSPLPVTGKSLVKTNSEDATSGDSVSEGAKEKEFSEESEVDAQVCDICGDVGFENLLAICKQCGEGAEHVYCMRKPLEEKPEFWLCEACKKIQRDNPSKQAEWQAAVDVLSKSASSITGKKGSVGDARTRIGARLDKKMFTRKAMKAIAGTQALPMKRPLEEVAAGPLAKRAALDESSAVGSLKVKENLPMTTSMRPALETGSSVGLSKKPVEEKSVSGKVGGDVQLKRPSEDSAAGPPPKRVSLGPNSGIVSTRSTNRMSYQRENSVKLGETGKVRFITPPMYSSMSGATTPGSARSAKFTGLPEASVSLLPRSSPRPLNPRDKSVGHVPSGGESSKAEDNAGGVIRSSTQVPKAFGNMRPQSEGVIPSKDAKGEVHSKRNNDGNRGGGPSQSVSGHVHVGQVRRQTDVSSAIASAKLVKELSSRSLNVGAEQKLSLDAARTTDVVSLPAHKSSKTLSRSSSTLTTPKALPTDSGIWQGKHAATTAKREEGASIAASKLQEKTSLQEKRIESTDELKAAAVGILARQLQQKNSILEKLTYGTDELKIAAAHHSSARVDVHGEAIKGDGHTLAKTDTLEAQLSCKNTIDLNGAIGMDSHDEKISSKDSLVPLIDQCGKDASGSSQHMAKNGANGEQSVKNATQTNYGKLTVVVNGVDSRKKEWLTKLDLNVEAQATDLDVEDSAGAGFQAPSMEKAEISGRTLSGLPLVADFQTGDISGRTLRDFHVAPDSEEFLRAETSGRTLSGLLLVPDPKEFLTADFLKRLEEADVKTGNRLTRSLSISSRKNTGDGRRESSSEEAGPEQVPRLCRSTFNLAMSGSSTKEVSGSSREKVNPCLLPLENEQIDATKLDRAFTCSVGISSKPSLSRLNICERGGIVLPLNAQARSSAVVSDQAGLNGGESTGKLSLQRPTTMHGGMDGLAQGSTGSAVPSHVIWSGSFDVGTKENARRSFESLAAYISSKAVPKVHDAARSLPSVLRLEEAQRFDKDSWPKQFFQKPPDDKSIALYFFASSPESYDKYYKRLLDRMMSNDLVLRGSVVDGAELLIISSHLLTPEFQSWRQQGFLWGVFRGRKTRSDTSSPLAMRQVPNVNVQAAETCGHPPSRFSPGDTHHVMVDMENPAEMKRYLRPSSTEYPPLPLEPPPESPPPPPAPWQDD